MADDHPLMAPPTLSDVDGLPTTPVAQDMAVALAMLLLGVVIVVLGAGDACRSEQSEECRSNVRRKVENLIRQL